MEPKIVFHQFVHVVNEQNFFQKIDMTHSEFIYHVESMDYNEFNEFGTVLDMCANNIKLNTKMYSKIDWLKRSYQWVVVEYPMGREELKFLTTPGLDQFIGIYQFGLYDCRFTFEGILEEAYRHN